MESLNTEEKVIRSNSLIEKYRLTNAIIFKNQAWEIFRVDLAKFVNTYFKGYSKEVKEDILQSMALVVCKLINKGSSFDPSKGVYLLTYARKSLLEAGYECVDSTKTSMAYNRKLLISLKKKIETVKRDIPDASDESIIEAFVKSKKPDISEQELNEKIYQLKNLLVVHQGSVSLDTPIDEDGTTRAELVADEGDFVKGIEQKDIFQLFIRIIDEMHSKKELSRLEHQAVKIMLTGKFENSTDAGESLGKSRQNFNRAFNKAKKKIPVYIRTKYPDVWEYLSNYFG